MQKIRKFLQGLLEKNSKQIEKQSHGQTDKNKRKEGILQDP